ncbi:MAG: UDP-N-acetylmuramoyl-L-alanyl-D-glutamate--2,6-diaminopimelate ligase [bacterium]
MKLRDVVEHIPGLVISGLVDLDAEVSRVSFDSRDVGPGCLFVALVGANSDGHRFVDVARDNGATAVLVNADSGCTDGLTCRDTRAMLPKLSAVVYGEPSCHLRVVGVTGTNGKTTTSYLLEQVFASAGARVGVIGTVGYRWGGRVEPAANTTPESAVLQGLMARMRADDVTHVMMEVSSHGLATHRVESTYFDAMLFTNLTQDHLDFHGTMTAYRDAKARLFGEHVVAARTAGKHPVAVINVADDYGDFMASCARGAGARVVTYGMPTADLSAENVQTSIQGTTFDLVMKDVADTGNARIVSPLLGRFNVENMLGVVGVARALGMPLEDVVAGLANASGPPGRLERALDAPATFVDYAHTPDALDNVIATLRPLAAGRLIVVCGCGGDRDRAKRPLMAQSCEAADIAILTSDNPRTENPESILEMMVAGLSQPVSSVFPEKGGVTVHVDRRAAIEMAVGRATPEDVVLIAGKGHETYQEIGTQRYPFDDLKIAQEAGRKR